MILCGPCKGKGLLLNETASALPTQCPRCQGFGIITLNDLWNGDHACLLYRNEREQLSTAIDFLKQGLDKNSRAIYITHEHTADEIKTALESRRVNVDRECKRGALFILSADETYLKNGVFEPVKMMEKVKELEQSALLNGFSAVRGTAEMSWALEKPEYLEALMEYEAMVDEHFTKSKPRSIALCQYNQSRFSAEMSRGAISTHGPAVVL